MINLAGTHYTYILRVTQHFKKFFNFLTYSLPWLLYPISISFLSHKKVL